MQKNRSNVFTNRFFGDFFGSNVLEWANSARNAIIFSLTSLSPLKKDYRISSFFNTLQGPNRRGLKPFEVQPGPASYFDVSYARLHFEWLQPAPVGALEGIKK